MTTLYRYRFGGVVERNKRQANRLTNNEGCIHRVSVRRKLFLFTSILRYIRRRGGWCTQHWLVFWYDVVLEKRMLVCGLWHVAVLFGDVICGVAVHFSLIEVDMLHACDMDMVISGLSYATRVNEEKGL